MIRRDNLNAQTALNSFGGSMPEKNHLERITVDKINDGQYVDGIFYCRSRKLALAKNNKTYIAMTLADKTGEIIGMAFDNAEKLATQFEEGDFVYIQSKAQSYQGRLQLIVMHVERISTEEIDANEFLPTGHFDPTVFFNALRKMVGTISHPGLRNLAYAILDDPQFGPAFKKAPAAVSIHHAYLGGLIEHTLSICLLAEKIAAHYPIINRDILLVGALLHDIGKILELSYSTTLDYTDSGRLIGHIILGIEMIRDKGKQIQDLDENILEQIIHIVASHHGTMEFGSPKIPAIPEAIIIHYLDNIDAKVFAYFDAIAEVRGSWTDYVRPLDTKDYRPFGSEEKKYSFQLPEERPDNPNFPKSKDTERRLQDKSANLPLFNKERE